MDEIVLRAIAKWPNVPSVYRWLALDRRGNWLVKGARISNPAIVEFIGRNYDRDTLGRWFFQNGPQRVFAQLGYTPFVYRVHPDASGKLLFQAHTGSEAQSVRAAWLDEQGDVLIDTDLGVGLIVDRDLSLVLERLTGAAGKALDDATLERLAHKSAPTNLELELQLAPHPIPLQRVRSSDVPSRFGFDPEPRPAPGEPEC